MLLDATSATAVAAPGSVTITLTVLDGDPGAVQPGIDLLIVDTGAGVCEAAPITAVVAAAKQITATFANTHSGTYAVRVCRGSYLAGVVFNQQGTTMTLTLYNGHPNNSGKTIAVITPPTNSYPYPITAAVDQGLYYQYTGGAAGDVTILAVPSL
jgi:hypothetical protein